MRCPSWMPGGISTSRLRSSSVRPAPEQASHGCSTIAPGPPQRAHGCARMNSPERGSRHLLDAPGSAAVVARRDRRARLDAVAAALSAAHRDLNGHFARDAGCRVLEVDLDLGRDVGATGAPRTGRHAEERRRRRRRRRCRRGFRSRRPSAGTRRCGARRDRSGRTARGSPDFESTSYASTTSLEALVRIRRVGDVRVQLAREAA